MRKQKDLLTKGRIVGEALHTHGFRGHQFSNTGVSRLDKLGAVLKLLAGTAVNLLLQFSELAGNVSGVAIQHRSVTGVDLAWVIQDDELKWKWNDVFKRECLNACFSLQQSSVCLQYVYLGWNHSNNDYLNSV